MYYSREELMDMSLSGRAGIRAAHRAIARAFGIRLDESFAASSVEHPGWVDAALKAQARLKAVHAVEAVDKLTEKFIQDELA